MSNLDQFVGKTSSTGSTGSSLDRYVGATQSKPQSLSDQIWGGLASFGSALTTSEQGFGGEAAAGIGASGAVKQNLSQVNQESANTKTAIQKSRQLKSQGIDTSKADAMIASTVKGGLGNGSDLSTVLPRSNDTNLQVAGNAAGVGMDILSAGQLEGVGKAATAPVGIGQGILQGVKSGAKAGAIIGAGQSFTKGLGAGQDIGSAGISGLQGGAAGAVGGAVIGGVAGGISGDINSRTAPTSVEDALSVTQPSTLN